MTAPVPPPFDEVLRLCNSAAPEPWYPARYAGDRDSLDEPLNRLRNAGLVRLTDWQPGIGQGYTLTDAGRAALDDPKAAARLRDGRLPAPRPVRVARRREREHASDPNSLLTVTNLAVTAMVVTFGIGMQLAVQAGMPWFKYLENGQSPLLNLFSLNPQAVAAGQWWRLWSYALVHIGGLHLLLNCYGHLIDGPMTEQMYGRWRFLALYLLATFGGALGALITSRAAAGSSGAWCGMIGGQVAYMAFHKERFTRESVRAWRLRTFHVALLTVFISAFPNVSWEGHLGGALAGFVAGVLLIWERDHAGWRHWLGLFGLVFLTAVGLGFVASRGGSFQSQALKRERADFAGRVAPVATAAQKRATDFFDDVADPLSDLKPEKRDADRVKAALDGLANLKSSEVKPALGIALGRAYMTSEVETARQATIESLAVLGQLLGEYEECFQRADGWSSQDEQKLLHIRAVALEADIKRRRLTRALAQ